MPAKTGTYLPTPSPIKYLEVYQWETGTWPTPQVNVFVNRCNHCANPVCIPACPNHAIYKEGKYGAVLIDPNVCVGARSCFAACPYGAPTFASDAQGEQANMCHMCVDRLETGLQPICVMSCSQRALDFDTLANLQKKYPNALKTLPEAPDPTITTPSVLYKALTPHVVGKLVPYDVPTTLSLAQKRGSLNPDGTAAADLFTATTDVTTIPAGLILRNKLVLKPANAQELMDRACTTEG